MRELERFLSHECGYIKLKQLGDKLMDITDQVLCELNQIKDEIVSCKTKHHEVLEQIGEASGRDEKLRLLAERMKEEAIDEAINSFDQWHEGLRKRISGKSQNWDSKYSQIWNQKKLQFYICACYGRKPN